MKTAAASRPAQAAPLLWWARAWDAVSLYLPVALMAALALVTWTIVQRPLEPASPRARALAAGEADYTLHGFVLRRHDPQGRLVQELRGDTLAHYPADGLSEVRQAHLVRIEPQTGWRSTGQAARLRADDARQHYTFEGDARYERVPLADRRGARLTLQAERLVWDAQRQLLVSDTPVRLTRDADVLTANRMRYDERLGLAEFEGRVRATLAPRPAGSRSTQ